MNYILKFKKYLIVAIMFILFITGLILIYFTNIKNYKPVYAASETLEKKDNKDENNESEKNKEEDKVEEFFVDIKGEVTNPGVYLVNENNIVNDVINLASGLTKNANTKCINLSMKVSPQMVIYVYSNTETRQIANNSKSQTSSVCNNLNNDAYTNLNEANKSNNVTTNNTNSSTQETNALININTADINQLMTLSGIGESKAKEIIKYREENGGFKNIEELKNVSGIGDATFEKLKDSITI